MTNLLVSKIERAASSVEGVESRERSFAYLERLRKVIKRLWTVWS